MNFEPVCGCGFTRIFHFRMSSDCGGARSLLRTDSTAEPVAWELVEVSWIAIHGSRRHCDPPRGPTCVRPLQNDVICSQNLPIMLALCSMLLCTYYAHFSAGIISAPYRSGFKTICSIPTQHSHSVKAPQSQYPGSHPP